jgi:hypothetical protein
VALPGVDPSTTVLLISKPMVRNPLRAKLDRQGETDVPLTDDPGDRLPAGHQLP